MSLSLSYGLIDSNCNNTNIATSTINHILPITKILPTTSDFFLTISRDGSVVLHDTLNPSKNVKFQLHSDWCSDIIQVAPYNFITVSHDLSIIWLNVYKKFELEDTNNDYTWCCNMEILGHHKDYVKKCILIENNNTEINDIEANDFLNIWEPNYFATIGLDSCLKIWEFNIPTPFIDNNTSDIGFTPTIDCKLIHDFNFQDELSLPNSPSSNSTIGSIYTITNVNKRQQNLNNYNFDLILGDCNGNLIFYSLIENKCIDVWWGVHSTNLKLIHLINDARWLITACSDNLIKLWDLSRGKRLCKLLWNCPIWSLQLIKDNQFIMADSNGCFNKISITMDTNDKIKLQTDLILKLIDFYPHDNFNNKHLGILDFKLINSNNEIYFALCSDSNLNKFNITTKKLNIEQGGIALTRSSLLANRRHVITENTIGQIQRWDIVSCELLDTFNKEDGNFDDLVLTFTSKEILSHWCTVSIKVGVLFVKINPKFSNTEVYGSALDSYEFINDDIILNKDARYNLGKIVVNSLFYDLINYEFKKDLKFRNKLADLKKAKNGIILPQDIKTDQIRQKSLPLSTVPSNQYSSAKSIDSDLDLLRSASPFYQTANASLDDTQSGLSRLTRSTENLRLNDPEEFKDLNNPNLKNVINNNNTSTRAASSGSLFSRKFKSFRSSKTAPTNSTMNNTTTNDTNRPHTANPFINNANDSKLDELHNTLHFISRDGVNFINQGSKNNSNILSKNENSKNKSTAIDPIATTAAEPIEGKKEFMSDLLKEISNSYIEQYNNNNSSLKLLSKRIPNSQLSRDTGLPIIQIKSNTLILVQSWDKGDCDGRVVFNTILPPSTSKPKVDKNSSNNGSTDNLSPLHSLSSHRTTSSESSISSDSSFFNDTVHDDMVNTVSYMNDHKLNTNNKVFFHKLEHNLPYWLATSILKGSHIITNGKQQKLNFILLPWSLDEDSSSEVNIDIEHEDNPLTQAPQFHNMFKLGRSKSSDSKQSKNDLPRISDKNCRLTAPGMIKVKKIKNYVEDRFETKTPEMKNKLDVSEWLELTCKNQILDNDMTLSTVRTLYWKQQGEIVIQYRRKI